MFYHLADGAACPVEGGEVGVVVAVDGGGHCHDVEVAIAYFLDVGGATEPVVCDGVLEEVVAYFEGCVMALHEGVDAGLVHVEAYGGVFCGEEPCEGQAYISEAYHADFDVFFHCFRVIGCSNTIPRLGAGRRAWSIRGCSRGGGGLCRWTRGSAGCRRRGWVRGWARLF